MENIEQIKVAVLEEQMKTVAKSVDNLSSKIDGLTDKIDNNYVKKEDFNPVKAEVEKIKFFLAKVTGIAFAVAVIVEYLFRLLSGK